LQEKQSNAMGDFYETGNLACFAVLRSALGLRRYPEVIDLSVPLLEFRATIRGLSKCNIFYRTYQTNKQTNKKKIERKNKQRKKENNAILNGYRA